MDTHVNKNPQVLSSVKVEYSDRGKIISLCTWGLILHNSNLYIKNITKINEKGKSVVLKGIAKNLYE
jgi:hypothetical protein